METKYFSQLRFFIKGSEQYGVILLFLAIIIGVIDSLSIALLYPMLSEGFQIQSSSLPINQIIIQLDSLLPIGSTFVHLGLIFIILSGVGLSLQLIYWKIAFFFKRKIILKIKKEIFKKIESNDYNFFVKTKQGDLINLFNQSPYYIEQTFDRIISLGTDLISSLIIIGMLFLISPGGLLLVMIGGGLFYVLLNKIGKTISERLGVLQIESGKSENKVITEFILGIKPILSLNASNHWKKQYIKALNIYWEFYADLSFIQRIPIIAINSLFYISIGIIVLLLYIYYAADFIKIVPVFGTFAAGSMKVLPKFMNLGDYKLQLTNFRPHVSTVYQYLNDNQYRTIKNGALSFEALQSDIVLDNICFGYGNTNTLENIAVTIEKGTMTALVGSSGSGKSTIVNLLLRLYDPQSGQILINNRNLKDFDIGSYRNRIGYVSQDSFIFNDTIRENINFNGEFSDLEIIDAAKLANAHEFITNFPDGYNTRAGDLGVILSGGEKQRIVIARAVIRKPDILILDEATSALDNISESTVQQAIDCVTKKCTTLVIAHRLTTIRNAKKIIVIDKGKIIEEGSHDELVNRRGKYYEMLNTSTNEMIT